MTATVTTLGPALSWRLIHDGATVIMLAELSGLTHTKHCAFEAQTQRECVEHALLLALAVPEDMAEIFSLQAQAVAATPQAAALSALAKQYDIRVQALAAGYSQYERESWPIQTAEATAYSVNPQTATPWLDAASTARGIGKAELAARVIAMDAAYRQIHGALTGHRQKLWDQINAAQTTDDIAAIDVTAGWPA